MCLSIYRFLSARKKIKPTPFCMKFFFFGGFVFFCFYFHYLCGIYIEYLSELVSLSLLSVPAKSVCGVFVGPLIVGIFY